MRSTLKTAILMMLLAITPMMANPGLFADDQRERNRDQELYDEAHDHLDEHEWSRAASKFRDVVNHRGPHADAGMYWLAYSMNKMGNQSEALTTLAQLQKAYPKSRWASDAKALEVEIRQSSGQRVEPGEVVDEDVKLMAIMGLMNTDPQRALPILEKIINGTASPKMKDKAIFVLSQSNDPKAQDVLARLARGGANPELQAKAIRHLGIMGGEHSRKLLAEVYASSNDEKVKESILKSYMIAGDRARLLDLAKNEPNLKLRGSAVRQLGIIGAQTELAELYDTETSVEVKKDIIKAMFIGGAADKLGQLALKERNPELRATAIKNLGLMGKKTAPTLLSLYENDPSPQIKHAVINGLFLQGNATELIKLAKREKDPAMKKSIVSKLALMQSDEVTDYLMDVLKD